MRRDGQFHWYHGGVLIAATLVLVTSPTVGKDKGDDSASGNDKTVVRKTEPKPSPTPRPPTAEEKPAFESMSLSIGPGRPAGAEKQGGGATKASASGKANTAGTPQGNKTDAAAAAKK